MTHFDVFNGDADGLCALHQLRLEAPRDAVLVTGVKRDVALVQRVTAGPGDSVTVLDVSLAANRAALLALLERGVTVQYFDHHFAGEPLAHPGLQAYLDPAPDVCTGMLVDRFLAGRQRAWAIVAAFGDNLFDAARALAVSLSLDAAAQAGLRALGEALAYNAYGESIADLIVPPAELYRRLAGYADPIRFLHEEPAVERIRAAQVADLERARAEAPRLATPAAAVYVLPDAAWSRRVRGVFGNELARAAPRRAHAVLTPASEGGYVVSVRVPQGTPIAADAFCRRYATGGGRATAAGIDLLPADDVPAFAREFARAFA